MSTLPAATDPPGGGTRERLRAALATATHRLGRAGVPSPSADARALIAAAARTDGPLALLDDLPGSFDADLEALLARRERREPLQLVLGRAPFRGLMLAVRAGVFIPRPETELIPDLLREHTQGPLETVIDLCAGGGTLGASVLDEMPAVRVLAVEIDPDAAGLARENLELAGPGRGRVLQADLTADPSGPQLQALAAEAPVDAVMANPPYIPPGAVPRDAEVLEHDPHRSLFGGGDDGLEVPRAVIAWAHRLLRPGGVLIMEHADVQGRAARAAARAGGFVQHSTVPDLTGRDRFLVARRATGDPTFGSETLTR